MTATATAMSADYDCGGIIVRGAEGIPQGVDGLAQEAEPDVGVDVCGDADMGVAEKFLDDDEVDALLQEQSCGRVAQAVEPDAAEPGTAEESAEAACEVGGVERATGRGGEDEPAVRPARPDGSRFLRLTLPVILEGADAFGGEGNAAFGCAGIGVQGGVRTVRPAGDPSWRSGNHWLRWS